MGNKLFTFFAASLVSFFGQAPAFGHYDPSEHSHAHGHRHSHTHKSKQKKSKSSSNEKAKNQFDPWQLLEMAIGITPAYAYVTKVSITMQGPYRVIRSNGIPDHATGEFPNEGNPNTMTEQHYEYRVPKEPVKTGNSTPLGMNPFGVAINGVPFDPGAAEWWRNDPRSGWQYEAMFLGPRLGIDRNNAHVQPNGAYHYHGLPTGLISKLASHGKPVLIGYAADGFPIYGPFDYRDPKDKNSGIKKMSSSYRLKAGQRPSPDGPGGRYDGAFTADYEYVKGLGDLDDCNGRFGVTSEYPDGTYHYIITDAFPYIPRGFKGTPDQTFIRRGPPGGPRGGGGMARAGQRNGYGRQGEDESYGPPGGGPPGFGSPGFSGGPPGFGGGGGQYGPPGFGPPGFGPPGQGGGPPGFSGGPPGQGGGPPGFNGGPPGQGGGPPGFNGGPPGQGGDQGPPGNGQGGGYGPPGHPVQGQQGQSGSSRRRGYVPRWGEANHKDSSGTRWGEDEYYDPGPPVGPQGGGGQPPR